MKIWRAMLVLCHDGCDNYDTAFKCEELKSDYKKTGDTYVETGRTFLVNYISATSITVRRINGGYSASIGFESKPSDNELYKLEHEMTDEIRKFIIQEKNEYIRESDKKIKCLMSW